MTAVYLGSIPLILWFLSWRFGKERTKLTSEVLTQNTAEHEANRDLLLSTAAIAMRVDGKVDGVISEVAIMKTDLGQVKAVAEAGELWRLGQDLQNRDIREQLVHHDEDVEEKRVVDDERSDRIEAAVV